MAHKHEHNEEPIEGSFAPRPASALAALELDGELLLLDPRTDGVHHLDRLGTIVWSVLDGEATVDELVDDIAAVFDADPHDVRHDLDGLLVGLRNAGALEGSDPPASDLVGGVAGADGTREEDGLWRPSYLVDPPAP